MRTEYDMSSRPPSGVPYKWEAAPGKPISGAAPVKSSKSSLPPPPGSSSGSRPTSFVAPKFASFSPEVEVLKPSGQPLAEKIFKKLVKLRKKSMFAAACLGLDTFRVEHSKRFDIEEAERCYDSDEHSGGLPSQSDQPDTPTSSISSLGFSSSDSLSTTGRCAPPSPASHQPGSQLMATVLLSLTPSDDDDCIEDDDSEDGDPLKGPRESAWHQPEDDVFTQQEWQMMRSGNSRGKISNNPVRHSSKSTTDHSYKYLTVGGTPRRSSMLPRLDEGMKHLGLEKS